jgi:hypothetical protein
MAWLAGVPRARGTFYIHFGAAMPTISRPFATTRAASVHRARREVRNGSQHLAGLVEAGERRGKFERCVATVRSSVCGSGSTRPPARVRPTHRAEYVTARALAHHRPPCQKLSRFVLRRVSSFTTSSRLGLMALTDNIVRRGSDVEPPVEGVNVLDSIGAAAPEFRHRPIATTRPAGRSNLTRVSR